MTTGASVIEEGKSLTRLEYLKRLILTDDFRITVGQLPYEGIIEVRRIKEPNTKLRDAASTQP
jgi:hypothetical protein